MSISHNTALIALFAILMSNAASLLGEELDIDIGRGPVPVYLPEALDPRVPVPLVMALHGYGSSGERQEAAMQFRAIADEYGFAYTWPDGTLDARGNRFWNATDACCDLFDSGIDDSGYLRALIEEIEALASIDGSRIYIVGHSNGGFMAHRMACDHADVLTAIASVAGSSWEDFERCAPAEPVHTLRIHGTGDKVIPYRGSERPKFRFPGAIELTYQWLHSNQCDPHIRIAEQRLDLDRRVPGAETLIASADRDCLAGGSSALWTMVRSNHSPALSNTGFSRRVIEYFYAHTKP